MKDEKLTPRNKWCYSIGGLRDVEYALVSMFLLVYIQYTVPLTDAQFAAIGVIMTLCKIWDAINDPMMATIVENSHLRGGKFRPWIIWGAVASGIVTALMFTVRIDSGWGYVAFIGIAYLMWGMTFTMNDVSYWSMLPSLSTNPKERDILTTLMNIFVSVASFAVAAVVPMVTGVDKVVRYRICALIVVAIFVSAQFVTYAGVRERKRDPAEKAEKEREDSIKRAEKEREDSIKAEQRKREDEMKAAEKAKEDARKQKEQERKDAAKAKEEARKQKEKERKEAAKKKEKEREERAKQKERERKERAKQKEQERKERERNRKK